MNRVYGFVMHHHRGMLSFTPLEWGIIALSGSVVAITVESLLALGVVIAVAFGLRWLSRAQHHRSDHLEIWLRRCTRMRGTRLLDRDYAWRAFPQRRAS